MYQMYTLSSVDFGQALDHALVTATKYAEKNGEEKPSWDNLLQFFVFESVKVTGLFDYYNVDTNEMERDDWNQLLKVIINWYGEKQQGKLSDVFPTPYEMSHTIDKWFNRYNH